MTVRVTVFLPADRFYMDPMSLKLVAQPEIGKWLEDRKIWDWREIRLDNNLKQPWTAGIVFKNITDDDLLEFKLVWQ